MSEQSPADRRSILELSPEERTERGIDDDEVRDTLIAVIDSGSREEKVFRDCTFPELEMDYLDVEGADNHPVRFHGCTFEQGVSVESADVMMPLLFEDCEIGGLEFDEAHFEYDVEIDESTITGEVHAEETRFDRDCEFEGTTFEAPVAFQEVTYGDDTSYERARFEAPVSFRGSEFTGKSNELDDNASFADAVFADEAVFAQAELQFSTFEGVTFEDRVSFREALMDGDVVFRDLTVGGEADFAESTFAEDVTFEGATFGGLANFEGAEFQGGARSLEDDARFVDVTFAGEADFQEAEFRYSNFEDAVFEERALFEEVWFNGDTDFVGATFRGLADFDESRFVEDADFSEVVFEGRAVFRGAEFRGHANQLADNASFDAAVFRDDANFTEAEFTSANFMRVEFAGTIDFQYAEFSDRLDCMVMATDDDPYVNFTDAVIHAGIITQPQDDWVRYDLTRASLGDVDLQSNHTGGSEQLLDYFRFCNTVFDEFDGDEFDFSSHTGYLDRNSWVLHEFDDTTDREYAIEMTPEVIETTYLNAKSAASAAGDMQAAGEFRVKRQQFARRKHWGIATDPSVDVRSRVRSGTRAAENAFLGVTCGHGMRLFRIFGVFAIAPFLFSLFYSFGGPAFMTTIGEQPGSVTAALTTPEGQSLLFKLVSFSYITFLTIGYGNIGPQGWAARIAVAAEVYLSVILGGLVLYALIKRSEM
jgi:uncharacterized protein YjbI with pentapeptide repeats